MVSHQTQVIKLWFYSKSHNLLCSSATQWFKLIIFCIYYIWSFNSRIELMAKLRAFRNDILNLPVCMQEKLLLLLLLSRMECKNDWITEFEIKPGLCQAVECQQKARSGVKIFRIVQWEIALSRYNAKYMDGETESNHGNTYCYST